MLRLATVILAMTWPQSLGQAGGAPGRSAVPAACIERFQRARDELISRARAAPTFRTDEPTVAARR